MPNTLDLASRIEVQIATDDCPSKLREEYENMLIIALARFGYGPYLSEVGIGFVVEKEALEPIEEAKE